MASRLVSAPRHLIPDHHQSAFPAAGYRPVKSSNVKVTTENGEVFLLGLVTEREGKAAADIASRVSGVKHVTTAFTYIK